MITLENIRQGSKVIVRPDFGMGTPIEVTVAELIPSIKNGQDGFDYRTKGATGFNWAYLNQIDKVVKY